MAKKPDVSVPAVEAPAFTKEQILNNAAQAMLAQAIETPQVILSLLN